MSDRRAHGGHGRAGALHGTSSAEPPRTDNSGLLLERVPAILYTAEAGGDGRWHYVSPQIEEILGFTPAQWCADPGMWADRLHPDDAQRVLDQEQAFADGAVALTSPIEYRLRHRDGHPVWVRDDALLREGPDGVKRWHGVMSDITEQKDAEAELALRAAQQAAVARLGEHALQGASLADLMQEAVSAGVELLSLEIGAVVELVPSEDAVAFRALHGLPRRTRQRQIPGRTGIAVGLCPAQRPAGGGDRLGDRAALRALAGAHPRRYHERPDRRHRGPPRAVRSPGLPFATRRGCSSRGTWTSCRRWPTCWATWWSASSPTTTSATEPCMIPSPACPTGCCSWTAWARPPSASAAAATRSPPSWPWTSTASSWSTRASATAPGTSCSPPPRHGCARPCARRTRWRASAATSSGSCSRTSPASRTPSTWPSGSPACSRARSCSTAMSTSSPPASASRWPRAESAPRTCCATPTPPCTAPRSVAARATSCLTRRCAGGPCRGCASRTTCAARSSATSSSCTTSRWCRCATARWSPWRRWCAGSTLSAAGSPPSTSFPWPRRTG